MTQLTIRPEFTDAGALARLDAGDLSIIQYPASELEPGPHQVWLRWRGDRRHHALGLTGPAGRAAVARSEHGVVLRGRHRDVEWELWWDQPSGGGRFGWGLRVVNSGRSTVELDAVWTVDVALTSWDALRRNELYVSQYLDLTPIKAGDRLLLAVRQNMPGDENPWLALGATRKVVGWCTDALQLRPAVPGGGLDLGGDLPSERLQHEHTLAGLQTEPWRLAPGEEGSVGFRGIVSAHHAAASSDADVEWLRPLLTEGWAQRAEQGDNGRQSVPTLFSPARIAHGEEPGETSPDGVRDRAHVVPRAKEASVLRPHGHIIRAAAGPFPQDLNAAVTVWMNGCFASQLTIGNASGQPLVSVRRSYLGLTQAEGVRLFVRVEEGWRLLALPTTWAVDASSATWWYRLDDRTVRVVTSLSLASLTVRVDVEGGPLDLLLSSTGEAELPGGSGPLFADGEPRPGPWHAVEHPSTTGFSLTLPLGQGPVGETELPPVPRIVGGDATARRLDEFLPWLMHNAFIHYQAPRGLEQFTGGAWGTRDVCQGPVGLLVAVDRFDVVREVLLTVFAGQQDDGDWPQWFDYLTDHRAPGHRDSHGDVVYWPLLALGDYLERTGEVGILEEAVGWTGQNQWLAPTPVREHVARAVDHLLAERSADRRLPAYGHGDWNDSLQPANPELAKQMVSTWTAGLEVKALATLADGLGDADATLAAQLREVAGATEEAIRERLLIDGELCGYAVVTADGVEPLVHPGDTRTGVQHGSLQMIHAIADELLTPGEALDHVRIIDEHLDGPAGIYLFDRPIDYHGGETRTFLRAEAATFWGREIGLMYTHAHIRWVEALLQLGLAERAWRALDLVIPDGLRAAVPGARPRQSNTYYSSVDVAFRDRLDAVTNASAMFDPTSDFEGGWRIYSSGPGLVLRLVTEGFLGLRRSRHGVVIDPVLPPGQWETTLSFGGSRLWATYDVTSEAREVRVTVDGVELETEPVPHRYRAAGARIPTAVWQRLVKRHDEVVLHVTAGVRPPGD